MRDAKNASKRRCISCNKKIEAKNEAKQSKDMLKKAVAKGGKYITLMILKSAPFRPREGHCQNQERQSRE